MELVQEMVEIQVAKEITKANEYNRTVRGFNSFDGNNIIVTFDGKVLGQVQSIACEASYEPIEIGSSETVERELFIGHSYEASMTVENTEVNHELLRELMSHTLTGIYEETTTILSRAERRQNERQKRAEECDDPYRKGIRNMLGGRQRWN